MIALFKKFGRALFHPGHALQRCSAALRQVASRRRIRSLTRIMGQNRNVVRTSPISNSNISDHIGVIISYKIAEPLRVLILTETLQILKRALRGSAVPIRVIDASDPPYASQSEPLFAQLDLPVFYETAPLRLCEAYLKMLRATRQRYTYVQLDDAVTLGLRPEFLHAACTLLDKYDGLLNVVSIELPVGVEIVATERAVNVVMFRQRNSGDKADYSFGVGPPLRLLWKERIGDYEFGVFENRFYGFYFHNLVVPTRDYASRLEWYMEHISQTSVHAIELAAADRTVGPYWTHLAICLSRVCMVDLDFAPTPGAVRPPNDCNRVVMEALRAGYEPRIRCETVDATGSAVTQAQTLGE